MNVTKPLAYQLSVSKAPSSLPKGKNSWTPQKWASDTPVLKRQSSTRRTKLMEIYNNLKLTSHSHQLRFNQELRRREGECEREAEEGKKKKKKTYYGFTTSSHTFIDTHTE